MFCVQYGFGSAAAASQLLSQIGAVLRPGGVLFGTSPDGDAILAMLDGQETVTLEPPAVPFVLRLTRTDAREGAPRGAEFGQGLCFSD